LASPRKRSRYRASGVPAQLAARLCALLRKQGDQDLNPFSHPHGPKRKGEVIAIFWESALSETAGAGSPGLIERPA
jgi:hypothetical protein